MGILQKLGISTIIGRWFSTLSPWEAYVKSTHYATAGHKSKQFTTEDYVELLDKLHELLIYTKPIEREDPKPLTVASLCNMLKTAPRQYEIQLKNSKGYTFLYRTDVYIDYDERSVTINTGD